MTNELLTCVLLAIFVSNVCPVLSWIYDTHRHDLLWQDPMSITIIKYYYMLLNITSQDTSLAEANRATMHLAFFDVPLSLSSSSLHHNLRSALSHLFLEPIWKATSKCHRPKSTWQDQSITIAWEHLPIHNFSDFFQLQCGFGPTAASNELLNRRCTNLRTVDRAVRLVSVPSRAVSGNQPNTYVVLTFLAPWMDFASCLRPIPALFTRTVGFPCSARMVLNIVLIFPGEDKSNW